MGLPTIWWLKPPLADDDLRPLKISVLFLLVGIGVLASATGLLGWAGLRRIRKARKLSPAACPACLYPAQSDRCPECGVTTNPQQRSEVWTRLDDWRSRFSTRMWQWFVVFVTILPLGVVAWYYLLIPNRPTRTEYLLCAVALAIQLPAFLCVSSCLRLLKQLRQAPIWPGSL
jgi:hypothetical protein